MASTLFLLFPYVLTLACSLLSVPSHSRSINLNTNNNNNANNGFSVSLIHRDSPQSPFYNHSMTTYERLAAAARRSINRQHHLNSLSSSSLSPNATTSSPDMSTKVVPDGEYVATINIGTPQTQIKLFIDTGSAQNWVKGAPNFDPSKSSSYRQMLCSETCPFESSCNTASNLCEFKESYADGRTASGVISYDDFFFDDATGATTVTVNALQFGYAADVSTFPDPHNGILGLSMQPESFISQLGITKFSHCFVGFEKADSPSRIHFGYSPVTANLATAIEPSKKNGYFVTLDAITINGKFVDIPPWALKLNQDGSGGVMLDTGSTFTHLRTEAYEPFKNEMKQSLNRPLVSPPFDTYDMCFSGTTEDYGGLPDLTFRFAHVGVQLGKSAIYVEAAEGVLCVGVLPLPYNFNIIGNIQMRDLLVNYDLEKMQIAFGAADCSVF